MGETIPHTMRAIRLMAYEGVSQLEMQEVITPIPAPGQVLVRVSAASVLPSDRMFCQGNYGARRTLPTTPGVEGAGVVVSAGSGMVGRLLMGRRVAFLADAERDGSWAEYVLVSAAACVPLWSSIRDDAAASLLFNPLVTLILLEQLKANGHTAVVVTAAEGTLGRMVVRMGREVGMKVVAVARRASKVDHLRSLGACEVFVESAEDFGSMLRGACRAWRVTAAIDGVGGQLAGEVFAALPDGGEMVVLGMRAGEMLPVRTRDLIFHRKRIRGFWLASYLEQSGGAKLMRMLPKLRRYGDTALQTDVGRRVSLEEVPAVMKSRDAVAGQGKLVILPGR